MEDYGKKIYARRIELGISQEELATKSTVSLRTIQRLESGNNVPRKSTLQLIYQALQIQNPEPKAKTSDVSLIK